MGSRERVTDFLTEAGAVVDLREFDESTKNSRLAAEALGCSLGEIAKSVVFMGRSAVVVVISGDRRVDQTKLSAVAGGPVRVASPDEVRESTGYPIGGVPPFPHLPGVMVVADRSIERFERVWAAAGTPNAVFGVKVVDLLRMAGTGLSDVSA